MYLTIQGNDTTESVTSNDVMAKKHIVCASNNIETTLLPLKDHEKSRSMRNY